MALRPWYNSIVTIRMKESDPDLLALITIKNVLNTLTADGRGKVMTYLKHELEQANFGLPEPSHGAQGSVAESHQRV
jgi:hypothetical protein